MGGAVVKVAGRVGLCCTAFGAKILCGLPGACVTCAHVWVMSLLSTECLLHIAVFVIRLQLGLFGKLCMTLWD